MEIATQHKAQLELKKHIYAIHCTNNLTLVQRKLFNALLFNAYKDLPYKNKFEIPVRKLCELIGYNSKDFKNLKKLLKALVTTALEWNVIDYESPKIKEKWKTSSIVSAATLEDGLCTYEYSSTMAEFLYQPALYGRLNLNLMAKFKSSYGIALYENCIRYSGLPQTQWFSLDVFRKLMGVQDNQYEAFNNFKRKVLDVAVKEVNDLSPILIVAELKRKNQKVVSIRFIISSKNEDHSKLKHENIQQDNVGLIDVLTETFNLSPEMIQKMYGTYGVEYIQQKIDFILNTENFKSGKIRSLAGFLIEALKNDYQPAKSSSEIIVAQRKTEELLKEKIKYEQKALEDAYAKYSEEGVARILQELSDEARTELVAEFEDHLKNEHIMFFEKYKQHGLSSPMIKAFFQGYIKSTGRAEGQILLTFDEYIAIKNDYPSVSQGDTFTG